MMDSTLFTDTADDLAGWVEDDPDGGKILRLERPITRTVRDSHGQRDEEVSELHIREPLARDLDRLASADLRSMRLFASGLVRGFSEKTLGGLHSRDGLRLIQVGASFLAPLDPALPDGDSPRVSTIGSGT